MWIAVRCQIRVHVSGRRRRAARRLVVVVVRPRIALSVVHLRAVVAGGLVTPVAILIVVPLIRVGIGQSSHVGRCIVG
jgi:hypothetical protein